MVCYRPKSQSLNYLSSQFTVHEALALSGEPMIPQIQSHYSSLKPQMTGFDIAAVNVEKREYQKEYMEYWNSTAELTGTGRAVDAVITPLAPMPANLSMTFDYIGLFSSLQLHLTGWHCGAEKNEG